MDVTPIASILTIASILKMDVDSDGTTIPAVKGKISNIYKPIRGGSGESAYKFQNFMLEDGGKKIKCTLVKRDDLDRNLKGKLVYISCSDGNHGMTGVKAKDNTYEKDGDSITERVLWITKSALIEEADGERRANRQADVENVPRGTKQEKMESRGPIEPSMPPAGATGTYRTNFQLFSMGDPNKDLLRAKARLGKYKNLYRACWLAAIKTLIEAGEDSRMPISEMIRDMPDQMLPIVKDIATTFFINGQNESLHMLMPHNECTLIKPHLSEPPPPARTPPPPPPPPPPPQEPEEPEDVDDIPF